MSSKARRRRSAATALPRRPGAQAAAESLPAAARPATPATPLARNRTLLGIVGALAVLAVALVVIWLLAPNFINDAPPTVSAASPEGRICFVRTSNDGSRDLYIVNADGTGLERATTDIRVEGTNVWSPDGRRILIQATVNNIQTVLRLDVGPDNKVTQALQLTADAQADSVSPAWSPDGAQIAFQSKRDGGDYQIFVMNVDGNNKRRLSGGKGYAGQPAWSPDGKSIAYVQGDEADRLKPKEIYVASVADEEGAEAGAEPKQITSAGKALSRPIWSPDGATIVYAEYLGDRFATLNAMNADGTNARVLVEQGANQGHHFSPVDDRIAYNSVDMATGSNIFIVRASGGMVSELTPLSGDDYQPTWSPDGKRLAWSGSRDGTFHIITANPDGTDQKTITEGKDSDYQPSWGAPIK
jgi:Tol biopolymer transport system component